MSAPLLTNDDIGSLMKIGSRQSFHTGDILFSMNTPSEASFLILEGCAVLEKSKSRSNFQVVEFLTYGDVAGLNFVDIHHHSCRAASDISAINIENIKLKNAVISNPKLSMLVHHIMHESITKIHRHLFCISKFQSEARLAYFLASYYNKNVIPQNKSSSGLMLPIKLPMRREDIASYLNMREETLSRSFRQLHNSGLIDYKKSKHNIHFSIKNLAKLEILGSISDDHGYVVGSMPS